MPTRSSGETPAENCPMCGGGPVEIIQRTAEHFDGSVRVGYTDELSKCAACGEEFYTTEQSQANSRVVAAALRDAHGLLSPERIYRARTNLSMTQAQFEQAMGVGPKTVGRWERGTVAPSRAANGMLWLAETYPSVFLEYARSRGAVAHGTRETAQVVARISAAQSANAPAVVVRLQTHGPGSQWRARGSADNNQTVAVSPKERGLG